MLPGMTMVGMADGSGTGSGGGVSFVNRDSYKSAVTPTDVTTTWQTTAAGSDISDGETTRTWLISGVAADYELIVTVTSGTLTSGTAGSWQSMNATLTYTKTRTSNIEGFSVVALRCKVRRVSDLVEIADFVVTITADVLA